MFHDQFDAGYNFYRFANHALAIRQTSKHNLFVFLTKRSGSLCKFTLHFY